MNRPVHVVEGRVFADSNIIDIVDPETADMSIYDDRGFGETGLLDFSQNGLALICATHLGNVAVTAEWWSSEPPGDAEAWEDIAEAGFAWAGAEMELWGVSDGELSVPIPGPGHYRLRVAARHRDEGEDRFGDDPKETFRMQLWPGEGTDLVALKATSRIGAYWRSVA